MDSAILFHRRPLAGVALGSLFAVLACGVLPNEVLLALAGAAFAGGILLLYCGKPFAPLLCAFSLLCFRIVLLDTSVALPGGAAGAWIGRIRSACDAALDTLFVDNGGAAKGILLGDKTDIAPEMLDQYRRAGLSHILAVSGLHITILCSALRFLLRGFRAVVALLLTVMFMLFYGALTGFSPSFCRAALMFLCVLLAHTVERRYDVLSSFCFAFAMILFVSPAAFYSVSFQLSFACIYGMLMLTEPISRLIRWPRSGFLSPASAFAVQIGILPLAAYYFRSVSPVGVVLSILVVPLIPLFIVPAFAAMLVYFVFPGVASVIAFVPNAFLNLLDTICAWTDSLPLYVSAPQTSVIALYFLSLLLLSPYYLPNAKRPPYLGLAVAGISILLWVLYPSLTS